MKQTAYYEHEDLIYSLKSVVRFYLLLDLLETVV